MSYDRYNSGNDRSEYGGGGSGRDNYYDQSNDFSGRSENQEYGRENQGYGRSEGQGYGRENQGYGRSEEQGYGRENQSYGRSEGQGYGRENQGQEYRDTRYQGNEPYSGGDDFSSAAQHASAHHDGGNSDLFSNALSFIQGRASSAGQGDIDEQHAVKAHQAMYGGGSDQGQTHDSNTVGAGAAMQALKMFTGGGSSDGGMDKNKLIGMAMAQAGKLWDEKQGNGANMVSLLYLCS